MPKNLRMVFSSHPDAWVSMNIVDTLREMGIDIVVHDWGRKYDFYATDWNTRQKAKMNDELLRLVEEEQRRAPVDLLLTYFWSRHIDGKIVDRIRDMGVKCVNFGCNNLHQFRIVRDIVPHYDYYWVSERDAVAMASSVGASPVRVQLAANPRYYYPMEVQRKYDMSFTGSCYGERIDIFTKVVRAGIDFHTFGLRWSDPRPAARVMGEQILPKRLFFKYQGRGLAWGFDELGKHMAETADSLRRLGGVGLEKFPARNADQRRLLHPPVDHDGMMRLFSESKISMNFSACGNSWDMPKRRLVQIKLRDFEAPMAGALLFTERQDELKEFYAIDKEIVCYEDVDDLIGKAKHFIKEPEEAAAIRKAARQRALRDHTWEKRFEELFRKVGLW